MGVYNPGLPRILGQEWVPIRDEELTFQPDVTSEEVGYTFSLATPHQLNNARFYINTLPSIQALSNIAVCNIYPRGYEALSGPIKKVIIPMNNGTLTGNAGFAALSSATASLSDALAFPSDFKNVVFKNPTNGNALSGQFYAYFATNDYASILQGKRILNVSLLYSGYAQMQDDTGRIVAFQRAPAVNWVQSTLVSLQALGGGNSLTYGAELNSELGSLNGLSNTAPDVASGTGTASGQKIARLNFGDASPFNTGSLPNTPWTYSVLRKFDQRNGTDGQVWVVVQVPAPNVTQYPTSAQFVLQYMALEVTYCEETRVAMGTTNLQYSLGINTIPMVDLNLNTNPILAAGDYTATMGFVSLGEPGFLAGNIAGELAKMNALREKAAIASLSGVEIDIPFPSYNRVGDTFSKVTTHVIPQVTLHTSGGPFFETHPYGRQARARVWGNNVAVQNLLDDGVGGLTSFPQVRFYARRWGSTTVPLTLSGLDAGGLSLPGTSGSYASTPDNAALDIVSDIDLRAEVTLASWTPSSEQILVAKWTTTGNQRSYFLSIEETGKIVINWSDNGTNDFFAVSTVSVTPPSSGRIAVRVTLDVNNGAGGNTATFYTAPSIAGTYTQLGSPVTQAFITSIFSSTAILEVGSFTAGTAFLTTGTIQAARVLNGIGGTEVANPNFSSQAAGTTSFTDAAGRVWTVNGSAAIIAGTTGSTVSITPSDFDNLPEILDGWREVTLRFSSVPKMGIVGGSPPVWQWSATGELAGNRWEILGAAAPAISGVTGNPYLNPGPASAQLGPATYGQPTAGSTIQLSWMPGIQPPVSGTTADPFSDATLIFSQDMPTVTGLSVAIANQPLSGVSLDCVAYPWYVPTSMAYNQLTWSPTSSSTPVTGFAYYELQRMDTIGNAWETIAELTSPSASGFRDYEARVGILNSYRIRSVNSSLFAGSWSSTATSTFTSPGLTGQGINATSRTLMFTSNKGQDGSKTLAYAMAFSSDTTEQFNFPEAGFTQFQFMYGRDYQTAFRPLERGGTVFQRTVLVQAAAISPPTLADFTSLRDLAWASLPYVCVRDEDGNRWYANVNVPQGRVMTNNREIYLADLNIVEVTATPAITVI